MPIQNYRFTSVAPGMSRPMLWIRVLNPGTKFGVYALALVDTGADDCVFPATVAIRLGHNLRSVAAKEIITASGTAYVYAHTTKIEILGIQPNGLPNNNILYTIPDTPIDFIQGGDNFLLGTRNFLSRFVLTIDYPRQVFSIRNPL